MLGVAPTLSSGAVTSSERVDRKVWRLSMVAMDLVDFDEDGPRLRGRGRNGRRAGREELRPPGGPRYIS